MGRKIAADVLDSRLRDWTITDDGSQKIQGPIRTWPAPILPPNDATPATYKANEALTRSGLPDAYAFLRGKIDRPKVVEDFEGVEGPPPMPAYADAMGMVHEARGIPQYRTVPEPLGSFANDIPGVDRYQVGMLVSFLRRTDAGALDAWGGFTGHDCQGLYRSLDLDDAGMPAGWYDYFSQKEGEIIANLKKWGGAKFTPAHQKAIVDGFIAIRSHATDGSKWDHFNRVKPLTFQILQTVAGGPKYIWNQPTTQEQKVLNHIWFELENHVNSQGRGFIASIGSAIGSAASSVGSSVASVAKGIATPVAALVTSPIKLASDIASGKNVFESLKDTVKRDLSSAKEIAPYVQAAISVIPGVGQGVNAAIAAGSALAQGKPITEALVSGLKNALPGGPIAASAFDVAYAAARGQNLGDAALQALVNNAPGGAIGKQAAQAAIAVAKGQNIQQAALGAAKGVALGLLPSGTPESVKQLATNVASGQNVIQAATSALGSEAMARLSPIGKGILDNTGPQLIGQVTNALPAIVPTDVRMVAQSLLNNPTLRSLPIEEVSRRLGVSTNVIRDGMGSVLQAVQKSGGAQVPSLSMARDLAAKIPMGTSFDSAMSAFGSRAAPKSYSHNVAQQAARAARLRRAGAVFHALGARGLDCGALDPKNMPTIQQGSTGEAVVQWQKILGITADGKFGPNTKLVTQSFQKKNGLTADGIVGPRTWSAGLVTVITTTPPQTVPGTSIPVSVPPPTTTAPIIAKVMPTIRRGSTGPEVKVWQTFLQIPADGAFGPQTEDATRSFQTKNGLVADGIVGPKTWEKAMSGTSVPTAPPVSTPTGPIVVSTPPVNIPTPMGPIVLPPSTTSIPTQIPMPTGPISIPTPTGPISIPTPTGPIVVSPPPMPPNPPGQPPPPPPVTTSPPGMPPVVLPPPGTTPPSHGASTGLLIGGAVVLGALLLMGSGSSGKIV